jgi:hypothetical protein
VDRLSRRRADGRSRHPAFGRVGHPLWDLELVLRRLRDAGLSLWRAADDGPPRTLRLSTLEWWGRLRLWLARDAGGGTG